MTELSSSAAATARGGWKAAWGALTDAVKGPKYLPQTYFALFALNALPTFARLGHDWAGEIADPDLSMAEIADFGITAAVLLVMMPFWIGLLRFFSGERDVYPERLAGLSLRMIGWMIALGLLFLIGIMGVMLVPVPIVMLAGFDQTGSQIVMAAFWVVGAAVLSWVMLRLTTFFPNLALREPAPLRTSFRETRGSVWYILRGWLSLLVLMTIFALATVIPTALILGVSGFDLNAFAALSLQRQEILPRILLSLLAGVWGTLFVSWQMAFVSRISRAIRGV